MSYRCTIYTTQAIKLQDIQNIVDNLPQEFSGYGGNSKQIWGWSCGCDIYNPKGTHIDIGGSESISGNIAKDFVNFVVYNLQNNYNVTGIVWN